MQTEKCLVGIIFYKLSHLISRDTRSCEFMLLEWPATMLITDILATYVCAAQFFLFGVKRRDEMIKAFATNLLQVCRKLAIAMPNSGDIKPKLLAKVLIAHVPMPTAMNYKSRGRPVGTSTGRLQHEARNGRVESDFLCGGDDGAALASAKLL